MNQRIKGARWRALALVLALLFRPAAVPVDLVAVDGWIYRP